MDAAVEDLFDAGALCVDAACDGTLEFVASYEDGERYNTAHFVLKDGVSELPATEVAVVFDAIVINEPPMLFINGESREQHSLHVWSGDPANVWLDVLDEDLAASDLFQLQVMGTLDTSLAPQARFDVAELSRWVLGCNEQAVITETAFSYTCNLAPVIEFLHHIWVLTPSEGEGTAVLQIVADDLGHTGQCPDATVLDPTPCPRLDGMVVTVSYSELEP